MTIGSAAPGAHRLRTMGGRDPHESHRAATPLEILLHNVINTLIIIGILISHSKGRNPFEFLPFVC